MSKKKKVMKIVGNKETKKDSTRGNIRKVFTATQNLKTDAEMLCFALLDR